MIARFLLPVLLIQRNWQRGLIKIDLKYASTFIRGRQGENQACVFLEQKSYQIYERNFRSGGPEVDIIARVGDTLCFVEVKSWQTLPVEELSRVFTKHKRARLLRAARLYMAKHPEYSQFRVRFDCIMLQGPDEDILHFEAAFDEST